MTDENKPNEGSTPGGSTPPPQPEPQPSVTAEPGAAPVIESNDDERTMAMLAHLLGIVVCFVGPLIIWIIKKDESKFVDDQGKEALNFQLLVLIVLAILGVITVITCGFGGIIAAPLAMVVGVVVIVFSIIAALKAKEGVVYRYPFNLRMIK